MAQTLPILHDVKDRLTAAMPDFLVDLFPDDVQHFKLHHPNGAVLLAYHGSDYDDPKTTDVALQTRTFGLAITVITRNQHNDYGAIVALDQIRGALLGYKPPHCGKLYLRKEQFDGADFGLWQYRMTLYCETPALEQVPTQNLPTFKRGVYTGTATPNTQK